MDELKEVEEVLPTTGLSRDYIKVFGPLNLHLRSIYGTSNPRIQGFARSNLVERGGYRFYKYTEWFDPKKYKNVVTEKNRGAVERLDAIVGELNELVGNIGIIVSAQDDNPASLRLFDEAMRLVLGPFYDKSMKEIAQNPALFNHYFSAGA